MAELFPVPQFLIQYLPYLVPFALILFLLSLPRILNRKMKVIISILLAVGLSFTPLFPYVQSIISSLGYSLTLIISGILTLIGLLIGKKRYGISGVSRGLPSRSSAAQNTLRKLEQDKAKLLNQLQTARGNLKKEKEISAKLNYINNQIRVLRARLGLPL
jgi:uncharacterized protein YlxW (UPF0749 family)